MHLLMVFPRIARDGGNNPRELDSVIEAHAGKEFDIVSRVIQSWAKIIQC